MKYIKKPVAVKAFQLKYKKKPIVVEAFQWTHHKQAVFEGCTLLNKPYKDLDTLGTPKWFYEALDKPNFIHAQQINGNQFRLFINNLLCSYIVFPNDWIIKEVNRGIYSCDPIYFKKAFERDKSKDAIQQSHIGC